MFALQNAGTSEIEIPGLSVSVHEIKSLTAKFDLTFVVRETADGLVAAAEYSTDLFKPETIERLLTNFRAVLEAVVNDPNTTPLDLPVMAEARAKSVEPGLLEKVTGVSPTTGLHRQLQEIWQDVLGKAFVGLRDNFFDLGGHSLLAMRLFAQMEKKLRRKIPLALLFKAPTIEQLAAAICENKTVCPASLLVEIQPAGSRPPIFWLHNLGGGGGGGLFVYRKLAQLLGADQPSFGVTAPAEPYDRIELMAKHYIDAIRSLQPIGPYFLGGYCFGGVVAFEMARQLTAAGHHVGLLAALESSLPPRTLSPSRWSPAFVGHILGNVPMLLDNVLHQSPSEIFQRLRRKTIALTKKAEHALHRPENSSGNIRSDELLDELVDMSHYPKDYRRTAQIHFNALVNYVPQTYAGRVTLFRTSKPPLFDWKPEVLWNCVATEGVDVKVIPGTHEKILEDPHVQALATRVRECLEEYQPDDLRVHAA
jgi:thioesterase domain-containing protein/acyl carrier protein